MGLPTSPYVPIAQQAAAKYGVPPEILLGTITQESQWNPGAVNVNTNGSVDYGIAQLNSKYHPDVYQLSIPDQIDRAAQTLAQNYKSKGNWFDAVTAYNGTGTAAITHADKVMAYASEYGYQAPLTGSALPLLSNQPTVAPTPSQVFANPFLGVSQVPGEVNVVNSWADLIGAATGTTPPPAIVGSLPPIAVTPGSPSVMDPVSGIGGQVGAALTSWWDSVVASIAGSWHNFTEWLSANTFNWAIAVVGGVVVIFATTALISPGGMAAPLKAASIMSKVK